MHILTPCFTVKFTVVEYCEYALLFFALVVVLAEFDTIFAETENINSVLSI